MSVTAQCPSCSKSFKAPDSMAGKKVRCRACAHSFVIPVSLQDAPEVEINLLEEGAHSPPPPPSPDDTPVAAPPAIIEELVTPSEQTKPSSAPKSSSSSKSAPSSKSPSASKPKSKSKDSSSASTVAATSPTGLLPQEMFEPVAGSGNVSVVHRPGWFNHPVVQLVDKWAPLAVVVVGFLWLAGSVAGVSPSEPGWIWLSRFGLIISLYTIIVAPMTLIGIKIATNIAGRPMPKGAITRVYTAYVPSMVLTVVLWNVGGGATPALVMGLILGLSVSAAAILLFFRLKPEETLPVAALGSGGFVLGSAIATAIALGLNYITIAGLREAKTTHPPPTSPYLPWINWDVTPPAPEAPTKPPAPRAAPTPAPTPQPPTDSGLLMPVNPPGPTTPPATGDGSAPRSPVTPARPEVRGPVMTMPQTSDSSTPPTPPTPPSPPTPSGSLTDSPLVASVTPIPTGGAFEGILRPLNASAAKSDLFAIARRPDGASVQIDVRNIGTTVLSSTSKFMNPPSAQNAAAPITSSYVISPEPALLARTATFPRPCIQIWSFEKQQVIETLDLTLERGESMPVLIGFVRPTRLVYFIPGRNKLYTADLGSPAKATDLPIAITADNSRIGIDPTGTTAAIAFLAPAETRGSARASAGHTLLIANLDAPITAPKRIAITKVATDFAVAPTGVAFTPDSSLVSLYYERGGSSVLLTCNPTTGKFLDREAVFPASASQPPLERQYSGSSILYLPDGKHLLVYGNGVISAEGRNLGQIDIPRVTAASLRPDGSLLLVQEPDGAPRAVLNVKLKEKALDPVAPRGDTRTAPPR